MTEELYSGYCFQADQARIVAAEFEAGKLMDADCLYETCLHRSKCEIGRRITAAIIDQSKAGKREESKL